MLGYTTLIYENFIFDLLLLLLYINSFSLEIILLNFNVFCYFYGDNKLT